MVKEIVSLTKGGNTKKLLTNMEAFYKSNHQGTQALQIIMDMEPQISHIQTLETNSSNTNPSSNKVETNSIQSS